MKTLQNNFTTPKQSKRLLELGIPADSADCFYGYYSIDFRNDELIPKLRYDSYSKRSCFFNDHTSFIPCWSVGRLIEIYHICVSRGFSFNVCFPNLMNEIMYKLGEAHRNGWLDLKKLEE